MPSLSLSTGEFWQTGHKADRFRDARNGNGESEFFSGGPWYFKAAAIHEDPGSLLPDTNTLLRGVLTFATSALPEHAIVSGVRLLLTPKIGTSPNSGVSIVQHPFPETEMSFQQFGQLTKTPMYGLDYEFYTHYAMQGDFVAGQTKTFSLATSPTDLASILVEQRSFFRVGVVQWNHDYMNSTTGFTNDCEFGVEFDCYYGVRPTLEIDYYLNSPKQIIWL